MKVLFIGGTGIISSAVSALAAEKGIELYLLNRGMNNGFAPEGVKYIKGDIRDYEGVAITLKDYDFDVVVDWIAYVPNHVEKDIELFKDKTRQYIFISSASAYQKPLLHYLITESTPLRNPFWPYSNDKIACEDLLIRHYRENGFPVTIVRPSYTYNKTTIPFLFNSKTQRWTIVDRMLKGKKIIVPGDGTSLFSITHNTDFAKGILGLFGNVQAIGQAFHITTDEVLTWNQFANAIGAAVGVEPILEHISSDFICKAAPDQTGGLLGEKSICNIMDNSKIKKFVPGFSATMSFREGIQQSIDWYRANPELCGIDEGFNCLCDKLIMAQQKAIEMFNQL